MNVVNNNQLCFIIINVSANNPMKSENIYDHTSCSDLPHVVGPFSHKYKMKAIYRYHFLGRLMKNG